MKKLLIIGNWKLNGNKKSIVDSLTKLINYNMFKHINIAIAPPVVYLSAINEYLINHQYIKLCAQTVDIQLSGAFTGDISANMLKDLGVQYVLIGHSERRIHHQENNQDIAKKFSILKETGLIPILCIGENKNEHKAGLTKSVCIQQINEIIESVGIQSFKDTIIAYEPIWAIGSGLNASPEHAQIIHKFIRNYLAQYDNSIANQVLIQYGGSANITNVIQFISQPDIDGILIGSAMLNINTFLSIIQSVEKFLQKKNDLKN